MARYPPSIDAVWVYDFLACSHAQKKGIAMNHEKDWHRTSLVLAILVSATAVICSWILRPPAFININSAGTTAAILNRRDGRVYVVRPDGRFEFGKDKMPPWPEE